MAAMVNIISTTVKPTPDIHILGVQIDSGLKWHAHVREMQEKMTKQILALAKATISTWGATFARAQDMYTAVVRLAMTYGSAVWRFPKELKGLPKWVQRRLSVMQNRCLGMFSGAYKRYAHTGPRGRDVCGFPPYILASHAGSFKQKSRYRTSGE